MPDAPAVQSWRIIIAELEADIARLTSGDALDDGGRIMSADWSPPIMPGALPDEFAHHVRALIERQREAIHELEDARRRAGARIVAVRAASSSRGGRGSVYLDVEG